MSEIARSRFPAPRLIADDGSHFDAVIVGSGFGGSVSALRLAEKGYSVLVLEKGRRFRAEDFPKTNWNLRRWFWLPALGLRGIFKMTFFRHVTILSGVGVGGGSLVYANTLPVPKTPFFEAPSWGHLGRWEDELRPHYAIARRMLGAVRNPCITLSDRVLEEVARDLGRAEHFQSNEVAVFFGPSGKTVPDPFFGGEGPERAGCTFCGACMTGCRHRAKNTLDMNYLWLAERRGAKVQADTEVRAVRPREGGGFVVEARFRAGFLLGRRHLRVTADRVFLAGGVLGTVDLLQRMKRDPQGLPRLSERLGSFVRTNSEALIGVVSPDRSLDFSEGVAITSILHTDPHSHVEPVRYGRGSGFFRILVSQHAGAGRNVFVRIAGAARNFFRRPWRWIRASFVRDWAKQSMVLLYMRALEGSLRLRRRRAWYNPFRRALRSEVSEGERPTAAIPEATDIAERFAEKVGGVTTSLVTETFFGIPSTAHILGGCCMGQDPEEGVIDPEHHVFGYEGLYVVDGAAVSANPGVNPSLTITAMAERALSLVPAKQPGARGPAEEG